MYIEEAGCCAVSEICDLHSSRTAKGAMLSFCDSQMTNDGYDPWGARDRRQNSDDLSAFYIFTGVIKLTEPQHGWQGGVTYGPRFAKFIKDNKLGEVSTLRGHPNRVNHPDHVVKVWVWHPNKRNLSIWYRENKSW
jgi:hypothetical protein